MELPVIIFIQQHHNRTYTVSVPRAPGISAYGRTLEECTSEVSLALIQRLESMDPAFVDQVAAVNGETLRVVDVELHPKRADGRRRRNTFELIVSLLQTPDGDQVRVLAPRLPMPPMGYPLAFYVRTPEELLDVARAEIIEYFADAPLEVLQSYQRSPIEFIQTLTVAFTPKSPLLSKEEQQGLEEASFWALRASGVNLTAQAKEGQLGRAYRREQTVKEVLRILAGEGRSSLILLGGSGVGKTAIVHEVARRIQRKECPEALFDRQLWSVSGGSLLAGMQFIGQWQEKLNNLVHEVRKQRHILVIDDIAGLADAGRWSKSDENMADFLKPYLQTGDVVILGESTPERLRYTDRLTPGFVNQFRIVPVEPTSSSDTLSILAAVVHRLEKDALVRVQPAALEAAVELTTRYLPYRALPGKAISLLEQTVHDAAGARSDQTRRLALDRRHVVASFTRQSGMPEFMLSDRVPLDIAQVRRHFAERVIGQVSAADVMTDLVAVIKAGLNDPEKPLGVYLFIGPTGVGKTEMAKTLAEYLFGDEKRLLRFDMSEYMDPAGVRRLIGLPGSDNEGELTGKVRTQPFCVLLLDEFEKADPQIYDLFLQVMGEGRLSDATGQTTSFQNAIILLTSNLGSGAREQRGLGLAASSQSAASDDPAYWRSKIEQYFRPEFINRIDQVVVFQPLDARTMHQIARRELGKVLMREGLVRRNVLADVDDDVIDLLVAEGFSPAYGARPLKRAIERLVVTPMARFLAARPDGGDLLKLRRQGERVTLSAAHLAGDERSVETRLGAAPLAGASQRRRLNDAALIEGFASLRLKLQVWSERPDVVSYEDQRSQALAAMNQPTFWDSSGRARHTMDRFYKLDRVLKRLRQLAERAEYLEELAGLVRRQRDASYREELAESYARLERDVAFLEIELLHVNSHGDAVTLILRTVGPRAKNDAGPLTRLAAMYGRWGLRKGFDVTFATSEPIEVTEAQVREARANLLLVVEDELDEDDDDLPDDMLLNSHDVVTAFAPYRWQPMPGGDVESRLRHLAGLTEARELAVVLEGSNVSAFLDSERGLHRINEKRPDGERLQAVVQVEVKWFSRANLSSEPFSRGMASAELKRLFFPSYAGPVDQPEVARVYQLSGQRHVVDPRTKVRHHDAEAVLEGDLDDFILAWLRMQQELGEAPA